MKKLLPLLFLIVFASCGEKGSSESSESKNILENLTYSIDTVVVDPGDEIISIQNEYELHRISTVSEDGQFFYLYNGSGPNLAIIDLNKLKLVELIPFDREGPNGIGGHVENLQVLSDERFLITTFKAAGIFDKQGLKLTNFPLNAEAYDGIDTDLPISELLTITSDERLLFSFSGFLNSSDKELVIIDPINKSGKIVKLPELEKVKELTVNFNGDQFSTTYMEPVYLQIFNKKLYISNGASSSVYTYDYESDSIRLVTFPHQLVPPAKSGSVKNEVSSQQEMTDEMRKVVSQVGFKELLWDDKSEHFFRLAAKSVPDANKKGPYDNEVYLFIYDSELNLLGESKLEGFTQDLRNYFFKDGKLWSYVNVEDELGFAVFTFDF